MSEVVSPEVERAMGLIERYLALHPEAADSADGLVRWWLARQCYEEVRAVADDALAEAVRRGLLDKRIAPGNGLIYHRAERSEQTRTDADGDC